MTQTALWIMPYLLSWVVHVTWVLWSWAPLFLLFLWIFKPKKPDACAYVAMVTVYVLYLPIIYFFSGCPFMYLHQWMEIQAGWREAITYSKEQCVAYVFIVRPLLQIFV